MTLKEGDWVVRKGFINFWPGQIIDLGPGPAPYYTRSVKIFWKDKNDWCWQDPEGLKKIPPLVLLAMQA